MDRGVLRCLLATTVCLLCHVKVIYSQDVITLCNSDIQPVNRTNFNINLGGNSQNQEQCTCMLTAHTHTYLDVTLSLPQPDFNFQGESIEGLNTPPVSNSNNPSFRQRNATCNPFVMLGGGGQSDLAKCAGGKKLGGSQLEDPSKFVLSLPAGRMIWITLHNHKQLAIEPNFKFLVSTGSLAVMCYSSFDSPVWDRDYCPCEVPSMVPGGAGDGTPARREETSTLQPGVVAAIIAVVVFLIIVAALAAFVWWRRSRGERELKDLEVVNTNNASENPAFTASQRSGLDRAAPNHEPEQPPPTTNHGGHIYSNVGGPDTKIPFDADPSLNLDMQSPPAGKGSNDSGLYSMPHEKGVVNNNGRYANAPLAPDQMYNPMLNAKQASAASLTGAGALHASTEQLDPSALYAKPNKPRNQYIPNPAPTRSASQDALNQRPKDGDLEQARSRSHNASMASMGSQVETDV